MVTGTKKPAVTWEHKGITIAITDSGTFLAEIEGNRQTAPSLAAMKDRIDKAAVRNFTPFGVIDLQSGKIISGRAIGIDRDGRGPKFIVQWDRHAAGNSNLLFRVFPDTHENRAALAARAEQEKIRSDAAAEISRLIDHVITMRNANE